jgi:SAM-dependent methyltransferase
MLEMNIDPVWEAKYSEGHAEQYPWDAIVSFVFRNAPRDRPRNLVSILEVGCGTGSNLWFAAREGFSVAGIDGSKSAIEFARRRFSQEGLVADLRVADFTDLPFGDRTFDLVLDRGSLTCVGKSVLGKSVDEVRRVLKLGGLFYFNPYSDRHSSSVAGKTGPDGTRVDIDAGSLRDVGQIRFSSKGDVETLLGPGWKLRSLEHREMVEMLKPEYSVHAEWRVIAERI